MPLLQELKPLAPSVVFGVAIEPDPMARWDGEGPDPADDGYYCYDSDVSATAILNGCFVAGHDTLGGSYYRSPEELLAANVSGYLPGMLLRAAEALAACTGLPESTLAELQAVIVFLKKRLVEEYEAQRRAINTIPA